MSNHGFSFEGGDILANIGATWFVSYAYFERIDSLHNNWEKVSTVPNRKFKYQSCRKYHKLWLNEVLLMNSHKLNCNTIGLNSEQTKQMARKILEKMN